MEQYFGMRRARERRRMRIKLYCISFLVLELAVLAFFTVRESSLFTVRSVTVTGVSDEMGKSLRTHIEATIIASSWKRLLGASNILAWPRRVSLTTPALASVLVTRHLLRREIAIAAKERVPYAIWCKRIGEETERAQRERCFWFDKDEGILLAEAPVPEGTLVFKVGEVSGLSVALGAPVLPPEQFKNFRAILGILQEKKLPVQDIAVHTALQEVRVATFPGARFIFSMRFDPTPAIPSAIEELLKEASLTRIAYADFTVPHKVFLKER